MNILFITYLLFARNCSAYMFALKKPLTEHYLAFKRILWIAVFSSSFSQRKKNCLFSFKIQAVYIRQKLVLRTIYYAIHNFLPASTPSLS